MIKPATLALIAFGAALLVSAAARAAPPSCADSPRRVAACFAVHGRLTACNGVPNARIWIVGTTRILGVEDPTGNPAGAPLLPGALERTMFDGPPCSKAAFGDFTVCPLTPRQTGVMQRVCVVSAKKLVFKADW